MMGDVSANVRLAQQLRYGYHKITSDHELAAAILRSQAHMASNRAFLGIDLGTTNTSIAYVIDDPRFAKERIVKVKAVSFDSDESRGTRSRRVPTIVSAQFDDRRVKTPLLGWQFFRQFERKKKGAAWLRHGQNFFRSVKSDLGTLRVYPRAFSKEFDTPEKVAAAIVKGLIARAKHDLSLTELDAVPVMITVPASLGHAARESTAVALEQAGLRREQIEFIDEPIAALVHLLNDPTASMVLTTDSAKNIVVFDYGGGTLDVCLVAAKFDGKTTTGFQVRNLAISRYARLGGDALDEDIMREVLWPQVEEKTSFLQSELEADERRRVEDTLTPTVARALKFTRIIRRLERIGTSGPQAR